LCCARRSTKQDTKDGRLVQLGRLTGVTDVFWAAQGFKVPFTMCNAPAICCASTCQQFLKVSCQLLQGLRRVESKAKFPEMRQFCMQGYNNVEANLPSFEDTPRAVI